MATLVTSNMTYMLDKYLAETTSYRSTATRRCRISSFLSLLILNPIFDYLQELHLKSRNLSDMFEPVQ